HCGGLDWGREAEEGRDAAALAGALAGAKPLLVLDNCEHIVQAAASLANQLVERFPQVHLLATSRERLGVTGEILWRVSPLTLPDVSEGTEEVLSYPAIQLFMERARAAEPGFQLATPEEVEAVRTIC